MMKHKKLLARPLAVLALLVLAGTALAYGGKDGDKDKDEKLGPYKLLTTISIPGNLAVGFDISWVDPEAGRYYLADRGTVSIDVIDTRNNTFLYAIPLQATGNGVVAIHRGNDEDDWEGAGELWVGDSKSNVEVVDPKTKSILAVIPTGGSNRADELAYDPLDHIVMIANDRDTPPYVTFISTKTRTVLGKLSYPQATGGLEQSVWNQKTKSFFFAVPSTVSNPNGEINEIDPNTRKVTRIIPTVCNPAGLVLVPGQRLVSSCGDVISIKSGKIVHVAGVGGDEAWFNSGDERVYVGGGTNRIGVPVVDTDTDTLVTTLTVGNLAVTPTHTTHSVAADSENNRIFVPVTHEGVKVFTGDTDSDHGHEE